MTRPTEKKTVQGEATQQSGTTEQPKKILLQFDQNELVILSEALVNMPFKVVHGLLNNIQSQINEQTK